MSFRSIDPFTFVVVISISADVMKLEERDFTCLCSDLYDLSALVGLFVLGLYKEDYLQI